MGCEGLVVDAECVPIEAILIDGRTSSVDDDQNLSLVEVELVEFFDSNNSVCSLILRCNNGVPNKPITDQYHVTLNIPMDRVTRGSKTHGIARVSGSTIWLDNGTFGCQTLPSNQIVKLP